MLQLEMGIELEEGGTLLLLDNQSAIKLAENPVFHKRGKHIAIKYHFIREKVENKEFNFEFVRTLSMAGDQLTKCKAAPKQVRHAQEAHAHTFRNTQDNEY